MHCTCHDSYLCAKSQKTCSLNFTTYLKDIAPHTKVKLFIITRQIFIPRFNYLKHLHRTNWYNKVIDYPGTISSNIIISRKPWRKPGWNILLNIITHRTHRKIVIIILKMPQIVWTITNVKIKCFYTILFGMMRVNITSEKT